MSGVFFVFEDLPHEISNFLWFNPLFHVTGQMRRGFYPTMSGTTSRPPSSSFLPLLWLFSGFFFCSVTVTGWSTNDAQH